MCDINPATAEGRLSAFYIIGLGDVAGPAGVLASALSKAVKLVVEDKVKYTDWSQRADIKAELKVGLILVLAEYGYPPVDRDQVYQEIFEQAENFKKYPGAANA